MPVTTPYAPNLPRRPRSGTVRGFSSGSGGQDYYNDAVGLYNSGIQIGPNGQAMPTRDYGALLQGASSQFNSLSRGAKPGQFSSLGTPLNSMYAMNPGFFNRAPRGQSRSDFRGNTSGGTDFAAQIAQRNQAMASGAPMAQPMIGQTDVSADPYFKPMNPAAPAPADTASANRNYWQEQADARRLIGEATGDIPVVTTPTITYPDGTSVPQMGARNIQGKYGSGFATSGPRKGEGLINGRPASEVLQGLANKPGIARPGDKYQPQNWYDMQRTKR